MKRKLPSLAATGALLNAHLQTSEPRSRDTLKFRLRCAIAVL